MLQNEVYASAITLINIYNLFSENNINFLKQNQTERMRITV